jgi:hypothetical protein
MALAFADFLGIAELPPAGIFAKMCRAAKSKGYEFFVLLL